MDRGLSQTLWPVPISYCMLAYVCECVSDCQCISVSLFVDMWRWEGWGLLFFFVDFALCEALLNCMKTAMQIKIEYYCHLCTLQKLMDSISYW